MCLCVRADLGPPPIIWALTLRPAVSSGNIDALRICRAGARVTIIIIISLYSASPFARSSQCLSLSYTPPASTATPCEFLRGPYTHTPTHTYINTLEGGKMATILDVDCSSCDADVRSGLDRGGWAELHFETPRAGNS